MQSLSSRHERNLILALAVIQFTHIVDFMIIMPLGPQFLNLFGISSFQLGLLVSSYALSSALAGLISALFLDRFERRRLLRIAYVLFGVATLACALSNSYYSLLSARIMAGLFGGLIGVLIQTIVADTIPFERRGRAMGLIMAAFSIASVAGVPLSLLAANQFGWQAPFYGLTVVIVLVLALTWNQIPLIDDHLQSARGSLWRAFGELLHNKRYALAYLFTFSTIFTGFVVIPFIAVYMQNNLGIAQSDIPIIYFIGGLATMVSAPLLGKLSDRFGKVVVFQSLAILAIIPILLVTHLPVSSFVLVVLVTTLFFIIVSGRMIPSMALLGSIPAPGERGAFMSLNNTVQSAGMALASFCGGWLSGSSAGKLLHFTHNGWVAVLASLCSALLLWLLMRGHQEADLR